MTLLAPGFLLLALLVPLALWARRRPAVPFAPPVAGLPGSWRVRLLFLPDALYGVGLLLALVALARPVERISVPRTTEGIDIMLCLDVSSSMTSNDMDPRRTRLDVAKSAADHFIAGRPDDRIGLITFARFPDVRCPPTQDHDALRQILSAVTPVAGDGPEDATGIGTAVARAAEVLRGGAVILLTDGDENIATARQPGEIAPLHAGQLCERLGVRAYTIAAGLGDIDTAQVRQLAERTGGRFFTARDAGAAASVYGEIDEIERIEFQEPDARVEESFLPFLAAAVGLLLVGRLLSMAVLP